MKVTNITNVHRFLDVLCSCKGDIELVTNQGDRINLKSKLCQHLELAEVFSNAKIMDLQVIANEPEDVRKIANFLIAG